MELNHKNMIAAFIICTLSVILSCSINVYASNIATTKPTNEIHNQADNAKYYYNNTKFLYSFQIPDNLTCIGDTAPSPNHGCRIYLPKSQESYLWVNADYNVADSLSPSDALLRGLDNLVQGGMEITVLRRTKITLAGLEGERFTVNYRKINTHEKSKSTVQDMVIAFRTIEGYGNIIYTIGLTTEKSLYKKNKTVLDTVLKSLILNNHQDN